MSGTSEANKLTVDQSSLHVNNILAHPGSTLAGVGVAAIAVGQVLSSGQMPTTKAGWGMFAFQMVMAVAAALGK